MMNSSKDSRHFQCPYCPKSLRFATHYVTHLSLIHGHLKNNYPCPYSGCVKNFCAVSNIKNHVYRCHGGESNMHGFKFVICPCGTHVNYSKEEFIKHISNDITLLGNVNCPIKNCSRSYINHKSFRTHMYRHHGNWQEWVLKDHFKFSYFISSQNANTKSIAEVEDSPLTESLDEDVDYNIFLSRFALKMEVKLNMSQTAISEVLSDMSNLLHLNSNVKIDNLKYLIESKNDMDSINEIILNCKKNKTCIESALSHGVISTAHKRKYYISHNPNFSKVEPVEYCAVDTEEVPILPSDDLQNLRRRSWNASNFSISQNSFSISSQEELSAADKNYGCTQKLHKPSYKLKREIIDILSKELTCYSLHPTLDMYKTATETLIKEFPFLRDPVGDGTCCWSIALKYRMQEIRRNTKVDEVKVNAGKLPKIARKKADSNTDLRRNGLKKPRKGEVNYIPEVPEGETLDTLIAHKDQLLYEFKKREPNNSIIEQKMSLTYTLRRQEIVKFPTGFSVFKKEWPMLFSPEMLQKEVIRLVGADIFPKIKFNLQNKELQQKAATIKKMSINFMSEEEVLKSLPKLFKENWSFYIEKAVPDSTTCLFSEDLIVEECELPPHPLIVETSKGWSIMGENALLLEDLDDFITAVSCLISIYHIFDINYHPSGQKSMLFLSVALAEIPSARKLPVKVHSLLSSMKLSNQ